MKPFFSLIVGLWSLLAMATVGTGIKGSDFFPLKGDQDKPLFKMKRQESVDAKEIASWIYDSDGKEIISEKVFYEDAAFKKYELKNQQLGTAGLIERRDSKLYFSYGPLDGKLEEKSEKYTDDFIVAATTVPYLLSQWTDLSSGKKVTARYGIADRMESIEFSFKKDREEEKDGQKILVLKMRPSNFIYAALVNPLYFYFDVATQRLLKLEGRVLPKQPVAKGQFKDFEARQIYHY